MMKMSRSCLRARLDRMPMLKVLVPLAAGAALAGTFVLPLWFLAGAFVATGILALLSGSSWAAAALLLVAGFGAAQLRTAAEPAVPRGVHTVYELVVEEFPAARGRYAAAEASVAAWRDPTDGSWRSSDARVVVYVDSLATLQPGERLRCRGAVRPFAEGAYRRRMERRGCAGTLRVSESAIVERLPARSSNLHRAAVRRLERLPLDPGAAAVVEALAAGERRAIGPELRTAYARSGLAHLLAVSGLHAGIVFAVVNLALGWLPLLRRGHLIRNLAAVALVWLYVAAAGFPPSAVRAAVMCSFLQTALASGSEYSGLNALAAAGVAMLLWNPAWLGEVGVQLSFATVAAILSWGVPLCRRVRSGKRWLDAAVGAWIVGLAASVAAAPLVAHRFGIVSLLGPLATPVFAVLAAGVVCGGVLWMAVPLDALAPLLGPAVGRAAGLLDVAVRRVAELPGSWVEWTPGAGTAAAIYLAYGLATLAVWSAEPKKSIPLRS